MIDGTTQGGRCDRRADGDRHDLELDMSPSPRPGRRRARRRLRDLHTVPGRRSGRHGRRGRHWRHRRPGLLYEVTTSNGSGDPAGTITADGAGLIEAGGDLGDVDLLTGTMLDSSIRGAAAADSLVVADMYDDGQLAIDAQRVAEQARLEAERRRLADEARRRAAARSRLSGVPEVLMAAINNAVEVAAIDQPDCRIDAPFLAAVAQNESGSWWDRLQPDGQMSPALRSPDGAKGPFQFMDPAWQTYGADGDGNGLADPDNAYDGAVASMRMHCAIARRSGTWT